MYSTVIVSKGPGGSMSWVVGLLNNLYKSITNTAWIRTRLCKLQKRVHATASNKVYQLLAHGRWFSPGTPASSTIKTGPHDIAESCIKHQNTCIGSLICNFELDQCDQNIFEGVSCEMQFSSSHKKTSHFKMDLSSQ